MPSRVTPEHPAEYEPEVYLDLALAFYPVNHLHQKKAAEAEA